MRKKFVNFWQTNASANMSPTRAFHSITSISSGVDVCWLKNLDLNVTLQIDLEPIVKLYFDMRFNMAMIVAMKKIRAVPR